MCASCQRGGQYCRHWNSACVQSGRGRSDRTSARRSTARRLRRRSCALYPRSPW